MQNFTLNDQNQALNSFKLYSLITTRGSYLSVTLVTRRAKTLYRCQLKAIVSQADCSSYLPPVLQFVHVALYYPRKTKRITEEVSY